MTNRASDPPPDSTPPAAAAAQEGLHCFGGEPAPFGTAEDLKELVRLPPAAKAGVWELLALALPEALPDGLDELLGRVSVKHELPEGQLVRALRVCRLLLRQAAKNNVPREAFGADLAALAGSSAPEVHALLIPHFAEAMEQLRHEIRYAALTDHGQLLTRVDWRVDLMKHAHRGVELEEPVVMVTLHLREGEERKRVTFQALPDTLQQLAAMCRQLLG